MFRTLARRLDSAAASRPAELMRVVDVVRVLVLAMVIVTVSVSAPRPSLHGRGLAITVALAVSAVSWVIWIRVAGRPRLLIPVLVVLGASGGVLAGLTPASGAVAVGCAAAFTSAVNLRADISLGIVAETVAAFLAAGLACGAGPGFLVGLSVAFTGMWSLGLTRHVFVARAEMAERTLADARRTHAAETQAAALAERARIAREIHDVLAHSLAAVSVNLQAAEGLLSELPAGNPQLAKAIECIGRAGVFTREGLADARRAILALRADAVPLSDQLSALAEEYRADGDDVSFGVAGPPRPVPAEAGLAAYRTAQEALTNARKHAPGQPVDISLGFAASEITVQVVNPLPADGAGGPLASSGGGYGLTGLRERAALGGGTLVAGPADGKWRVCMRIPA